MKIVIVGGVAGGASAGARARRLDEHAEILLVQSGPDVSFASCGMPYYIGGEITDRGVMAVQTPKSLHAKLNINVKVNTRVMEIDTAQKTVLIRNEETGDTMTERYDELVLAVGAEPLKPPIPGIERENLFSLRNLQDMDKIDNFIAKKTCPASDQLHCVVAGAGFVGLEMVEQLMRRNVQVSLVEMMPQILGPLDVEMANILQKDLQARGVNVITGDGIKEFQAAPKNEVDTVVVLQSGRKIAPAQFIILGLGVRPDTAVVKQAIECTPRGHIVVDEHLHTNADHVWAVGDAIEAINPIVGGTWVVPLRLRARAEVQSVNKRRHCLMVLQ